MLESWPIAGLLLIAPLLLYAGYSDLRRLRIPNWISLAIVAVFVCLIPMLSGSELLARISVAGLVFVLGFLLFALNVLGAGDVKLLAALILLVPSTQTALFFVILSPAMILGIGLITLLRQRPLAAMAGWQSITTPRAFPMGISISGAGLALLLINLV